MARRNDSFLDVLLKFSWRVNIVLAIIVYVSFKYLIPRIEFQNIFFNAFSKMAPNLAPIFAGLILCVAVFSAISAWKRGQLFSGAKDIETIRKLSWREFEQLVGEAYRRKGYAVTETGGGGADGGVDLVLKRNGEKLFVQCKQWRMSKIGVKTIRELYGVVMAEGATGGIVVSSGTFTLEATEFAKGKSLELLDGAKLLKIMVDIHKPKEQLPYKSTNKICPLCGADMVLRTAKKGNNIGEKFWGCSAFPKIGRAHV